MTAEVNQNSGERDLVRHLPSTRPSRVELTLVALLVLAVIIGATWLINREIGSRIGGAPHALTNAALIMEI